MVPMRTRLIFVAQASEFSLVGATPVLLHAELVALGVGHDGELFPDP